MWGLPGVGACRLAEAAPSSEGTEGSLQGALSTPAHLQPPACQATGSIMNEALPVLAGLKTGERGAFL